jgi:hypothetical protein
MRPADGDLRAMLTFFRIGTFLGHKGAVYQARLSPDAATAATASADFTAQVPLPPPIAAPFLTDSFSGEYGIPTPAIHFTHSNINTSSEQLHFLRNETVCSLQEAWRRNSEFSTFLE